jgi:RNA polymerase sigma-70 factor (ECF subfamily)
VRVYAYSAADQADLAQEMALQLWKSYASFQGQSQFSTWMYRVCLNTALTYYKVTQRNTTLPMEELSLTSDNESESKEERLELLFQLIHQLPVFDRAVIFLYLEGLSGREMANSLGISEGNVRVKLTRIKAKLKDQFSKYGYEF